MGKIYRYTRAEVDAARGPVALIRLGMGLLALYLAITGNIAGALTLLCYQTLSRLFEWLDPPEIIELEGSKAERKL